jgi:hypothetical protein
VHLTFRYPRLARCPDCGAAIARFARQEHHCDRERLIDYQVNQLEDEIDAYLASPRGRLELWLATGERRCSAS